jgi:serine kinase of HPr protein (carbohydrate metabolism regulator)
MKLKEIVKKLDLSELTKIEDKDINGVFISDMLSDVMSIAKPDDLWLTVQTHKNIISAANLVDIGVVVIAHNKKVPKETIELANRFNISMVSSDLSTFEIVSKLIEVGLKPKE